MFFESGADVHTEVAAGQTPLQIASRWGHAEAVRLLLESGADASTEVADGDTALQEASRYGHTEVVRLLLRISKVMINCF